MYVILATLTQDRNTDCLIRVFGNGSVPRAFERDAGAGLCLNPSLHGHTIPLVGSFKEGIGPALALLRSQAGISQSELARRRGKADQSRLSRMEDRKLYPSTELIDAYLEHCGRDVEDLAEAFLGPDATEEALIQRALRALGLGEMPPDLQEVALEHLRTLRRLLEERVKNESQDDDS